MTLTLTDNLDKIIYALVDPLALTGLVIAGGVILYCFAVYIMSRAEL